ncbi:MAG: bifunctional adenosylcobinamide kinase/adenosylcobinamide-phosphate guanylyltransferase [Syntrophales bacterium]|nr:bifunctional adenosylcobinamide kinase/adenosylcobinamide-phosphate guanylyltransferase [Syntrophales bacterium]
MIIFVTGGARGGKSDFAQDLVEKLSGKRLFLATAQALDDEMRQRIEKHREQRGNRWDTLEEPVHLGRVLRSAAGSYDAVLVDCFTVWMSNLLLEYNPPIPPLLKGGQRGILPFNKGGMGGFSDGKISEIVDDFFSSIDEFKGTIVIVSNEVGMGIVPENKLARKYRDQLGFLNQRIARRADEVYALISGIPIKIK